MNSARPSTLGWLASGRRSSTSSRAPEVSRWVAGTQLDNCTRRSIAVAIEASRKYCRPGTPSTLAISWGSQIAVVTPWASTQRSNSSGVISELSTCRCVSMKPGDDDLAGNVDLDRAAIIAERADDAVADDRDVALAQFAADEIEDPPALQHQIGRRLAAPGGDRAGEKGGDIVHRPRASARG